MGAVPGLGDGDDAWLSSVERVFREASGRAVATLVRSFGDIDLAEEAVQEAFLEALQRWPERGLPPNPAAWIITAGKHRALDRVRRESTRDDRQAEASRRDELARDDREEVGAVVDDRLRLIFTCCHPALAPEARVALTLRLLGGLQTPEIARAFLVPEATMAQRIVRAKAKIKNAGIPYRVPEAADLPARLGGVLAVVYLIFTEGHTASAGADLVRADLCAEAVRLARVLASLLPEEQEVQGLLALLLLTEARRPARTDESGDLVRLGDQDRERWDRVLIAEGQAIVRACLAAGRPGPYQVQAAIAAVHSDAPIAAATDWDQVVQLYDLLARLDPSPVVALNRAIALAERDGPAAGLAILDGLAERLAGYHLLHAARADLLERCGQRADAFDAYDRALERVTNQAERALLLRRRDDLRGGSDQPR